MVTPQEDRNAALELVREYLEEHFRYGSSDVRVTISNIADEDWLELPFARSTRFPDGEIKTERVAIGLEVEWVRALPEARQSATIPVTHE